MSKINNTPLLALVPESIKHDSTIIASAKALDTHLQSASLSLPDLLLYSRLAKNQLKDFLPPLQRLTKAKGELSPLPLALLEQLAWQFHLDFREIAKTDEELRLMILDSINWHRIKGTPKSIILALKLFGYEVNLEEHNTGEAWAVYQIGLNQVQSLNEIHEIVKIANEMAPARCKLFRIYTEEFDLRPAIYSELLGYSDVYYSFYSGLDYTVDGEDIIVSLGRKSKAQTEPVNISIQSGITKLRGSKTPYIDCLCYSEANYSELAITSSGFARSRLRAIVFGETILSPYTWQGSWDNRPWYQLITIGRKALEFSMIRISIANAEAVFSDSIYSDINTNYSKPNASVINNPSFYTNSMYSDSQGMQQFELHEFYTKNYQTQSSSNTFTNPQSTWLRQGEHSAIATKLLPNNHLWLGEWDHRKWRAVSAITNIQHFKE